jgi:hypothetical protein
MSPADAAAAWFFIEALQRAGVTTSAAAWQFANGLPNSPTKTLYIKLLLDWGI